LAHVPSVLSFPIGLENEMTVEILDVTKTYGDHRAVDGLSLHVPRGSVYGFIGPNGSGKTTTIRMIMNIIHADSGTIRVFGEERRGTHTDRIGYLPEERGLYRKMKVAPLLRFYGEMKNGKSIGSEVDQWLERFGIADWADRKVESLSKGMSQKVQFISAVVSRPEMLILDEPFTGLDPVNVDTIRDAILELKAGGTTIIFSTHDMATAEKMCDFIFMIHEGKKVLDGTLTAIQDKYGNDTARVRIDGDAALLREIPGVNGTRDHGRLQELHLAGGADPQEILTRILSRARVRHFELTRPSLHDIFVRIARPKGKGGTDVQVA
jgi:ABC-2 type transport system ATP-binding protein